MRNYIADLTDRTFGHIEVGHILPTVATIHLNLTKCDLQSILIKEYMILSDQKHVPYGVAMVPTFYTFGVIHLKLS